MVRSVQNLELLLTCSRAVRCGAWRSCLMERPFPFKPDVELIDTPPALDDSVPGILRADALIIPLLTEFQGVLALQDMLEYLAATREKHPALQIIGILPTRFVRRWKPQEGFLQEIRLLGEGFGVYVFDPIPESKAVSATISAMAWTCIRMTDGMAPSWPSQMAKSGGTMTSP
jgi:cellulose biosynthesis protein BcsQ